MEFALAIAITALIVGGATYALVRHNERNRGRGGPQPSTQAHDADEDRLTEVRRRVADLTVDVESLAQRIEETNESLRRTQNKMSARVSAEKRRRNGDEDEDGELDFSDLMPFIGSMARPQQPPAAPTPSQNEPRRDVDEHWRD